MNADSDAVYRVQYQSSADPLPVQVQVWPLSQSVVSDCGVLIANVRFLGSNCGITFIISFYQWDDECLVLGGITLNLVT